MSELVSKRCENCGKTKKISEFPVCKVREDNSEIWCKSCKKDNVITLELLKDYLIMNGIEFNDLNWQSSFEWSKNRELKKHPNHKDLPENFNEIVERSAIGKYNQQQNIIGDFKTSSISKINKKNKKKINNKPISDFEVTDDILKRWGYGLELDEYEYLEDVYQSLISTYKSDTPVQRMLYEEISKTRMEAEKARKSNNITLYEKLISATSKLLNDANIKPVQETAADNEGLGTWGEWVRKIEEEEPIPEPLKEFKDIDGIGKYINEWFIEHFARIFGLESENKLNIIENDIDKIENGDINGRLSEFSSE